MAGVPGRYVWPGNLEKPVDPVGETDRCGYGDAGTDGSGGTASGSGGPDRSPDGGSEGKSGCYGGYAAGS